MTSAPQLLDRWVIAGNDPVLLRAADPNPSAPAIVHLYGFAISGRYMLPTALLLADDFRTFVPDLPGFGRSPRPPGGMTISGLADSVAAVLDAVEVERATVVGNSLGCAVLSAFAQRHPDRLDRAVLGSPAGGVHSQPLLRAIGQLAIDANREPISMARVAVPDHLGFGLIGSLRLFAEMTRFDALSARDQLQPSPRAGRTDPGVRRRPSTAPAGLAADTGRSPITILRTGPASAR